jgi:hypothetical protein
MSKDKLYDAFLSHNSKDKNFIEQVAQKLQEDYKIKIWLDKWNIIPGRDFQEEIEKGIFSSRSCVIFLGDNDAGKWQFEEIKLAIVNRIEQKDLKIVPVLLPDIDFPDKQSKLPAFLRGLRWIKLHGIDDKDGFELIYCGIMDILPSHNINPTGECPYKGLESFTEKDKKYFFGRDALIQKYLNHIDKNDIIAVIGPSGSGKSSVVKAGIIPGLKAKYGGESVLIFTPNKHPVEELVFSLYNSYKKHLKDFVPEKLIKEIKKKPLALHFFGRKLSGSITSQNLFIIIDQFEEIFTMTESEKEKTIFVNAITQCLDESSGFIKFIMALLLNEWVE